jgi:hypothetical protein
MNKTIWIIFISLVLALSFLVVRDCKTSKQLSELVDIEKKYAACRTISTADHEIQQGIIGQKNKEIGEKNTVIASLNQDIKKDKSEIKKLSNRLDELQNAEPSYSELEKHPLVINLRGQIKTLGNMYSLAIETIDKQSLVIDAWTTKYNLQVWISAAWEKQYNDEKALRLMSEGLSDKWKLAAQRADKNNKLYKVLAIAGGAIAGYALIK